MKGDDVGERARLACCLVFGRVEQNLDWWQATATRSTIAVIVSTAVDPNSFLDLWAPTILDHHPYKYVWLR